MYDTDEEQIEALKKWWHQYGNTLIVAIIVFIAGYFGINYYQHGVQSTKEQASDVYQKLVDMNIENQTLSAEQKGDAEKLIEQLKSDYDKSTYAVFAAMYGAKFDVEAQDLDAALTELQWALEHNKDDALGKTLRLRIARIQLTQGKTDEALKTIAVDAGAQVANFEELRGDIYLAMGKVDDARTAFQLAYNDAKEKQLNRPVLEMKLNDLAVTE
ncbi:YfgM family protein [Gynuella sp.]|uniref:YfgM family protein n=1 Tax=Gynuella sp. TaxID=2969146 RepID=UPI003D12C848